MQQYIIGKDMRLSLSDKGQRITIGGRRLDEVMIRHTGPTSSKSCVSTSYPCSRHRARVDGDTIVITAQAATIAKLFADGLIPPIGKDTVEISIDGKPHGPHVLSAIEIGEWSAVDHPLELKFRRPLTPKSPSKNEHILD